MANRAVILVAAAVAVAGGLGYYLTNRDASGLDAAGRDFIAQVEVERSRETVNADECRAIMLELSKHPQASSHRDLIRARAWLELLIGRSTQALALVENNLGVEQTPEDQLLGSKVFAMRFAETANDEFAHQASVLARSHFDATGNRSSLFLAWQMQVRRGDESRRKELGDLLVQRFPESDIAALVKVLVAYPAQREDPAALPELQRLEQSEQFTEIPEELDLALAMFELESPDTRGSGMSRIERVLRSFPGSITARTIGSIGALLRNEPGRARSWLEALLRQNDNHSMVPKWRGLMDAVVAAERAGDPETPVKKDPAEEVPAKEGTEKPKKKKPAKKKTKKKTAPKRGGS